MAKKPKPTPKLDGTVKVADQTRMAIPEYVRPYHDFQIQARIGKNVRISKRVINSATGAYETTDVEGTISDMNSNMVQINTGSEFKSTPWWAVHDWEILGEVDI